MNGCSEVIKKLYDMRLVCAVYGDDEAIQTINDVIALLKEQEPRILSWREVKRLDGIESPAVWLEDYDKIHVIPALGLTTGFMDDDKAAFRVRGRTVTANCSDYGKRWRAWTSRPTEEQRKAVAWEPPKEEDSVR